MSARDCRQSPSRGEQLTKLVLLYLGDATSQRHQHLNIMRREGLALQCKVPHASHVTVAKAVDSMSAMRHCIMEKLFAVNALEEFVIFRDRL
jgi:hypothetical protein